MEYIPELYQQITAVLSVLDTKECPEIYAYLSCLINEEEEIEKTPYEIATDLIELDKPEILPQILIDFITDLYEEEIEIGNADAMNDLGSHYYVGRRGFLQSFSEAVELYHQAAMNGNRQAQENLGYCYYYGRDMERDYEKAFHYFALGAFDGHLISLYKIGDMYLNGYYVEKNEKEAFHIYMRCLDTMTDEAAEVAAGPVYLRLGKMFLNGIGTDADPKAALICYQKAESYLYDMVKNGDVMYQKSMEAAIEEQGKAREKLHDLLPGESWGWD